MQKVPENIHFIGIGGSGMSGLAYILLKMGKNVTGSDLNRSPVIERLESEGAKCFKGHRAENIQSPDLVVISTAIPNDNPELCKVKGKKIPIIHRGELLALLMEHQYGIAVCGAHGKTTTTSMMATVLEKNNFDPTLIIGGELPEIGGNAKYGRGKYLLAEADESDGSFLKLAPKIAVVTNIEDDHLDYYGNMQEMESAFAKFLNSIPEDGLAVVCVDDPVIQRIIENFSKTLITYGVTQKNAGYTVENIFLENGATGSEVYYKGEYLGNLKLPLPGKHNLANAMAVVATCCSLGISFSQINEALHNFKGAGRRFQLLGEINGIKIIDDYAHHPSEIQATLQAAKQLTPKKIISVFQPHRYSRTAQLYERFGQVFEEADEVVINEVYSAGEKPIEAVDATLIVNALKSNGKENVKYFYSQEEIVDYLYDIVEEGDLVLTMGAGNIWSTGVKLVEKLEEKYK